MGVGGGGRGGGCGVWLGGADAVPQQNCQLVQ